MAASPASPEHASAPPERPARVGLGTVIALGAVLARRGALRVIAMGICAVTALALCGLALSYASEPTLLRSVSGWTASAIAWGGAMLHAIVASTNALRRDRAEGVVELFLARTLSLQAYVVARVGGLAVMLAAEVVGGTLLVAAVALLASARGADALVIVESLFGDVAFALAFGFVIAPIVFATLGGRSLYRGYLLLVLVLLVPELLSGKLVALVPEEIAELCAIPSALSALRSSVSPGSVEPLRALRALVALVAISAVATLFVQREVLRLELESEDA